MKNRLTLVNKLNFILSGEQAANHSANNV